MSRLFIAFVACIVLLSSFTPVSQISYGDTGGPSDSGQQTPGGLAIFNNSGDNWVLAHGDNLRFNDSQIHMDGNITLESCSNLTLNNSILYITGWIDVQPGSRLILESSTITFNLTADCEYFLKIENASLDIFDHDDNPSAAGYTSKIKTNNSLGFEFNASGSWLNISDAKINGAGSGTPAYEAQRGFNIRNCEMNTSHSFFNNCNDGIVSSGSNITVTDSKITGTHGVIAEMGSLSIDNLTVDCTSTEIELLDMDMINITDLSITQEDIYDMVMTGSSAGLNLTSGNVKLLNTSFTLEAISGSAVLYDMNYLDIDVYDDQGQPYQGALVSIKDKNEAEKYNLTLPSGSASGIEITSVIRNATATIHYNPYNITATHPASIMTNSTETAINSTTALNITLPASAYHGNWNITGDMVLINKTVNMYGNINITSNSNLTLINTTIIFQPVMGSQYMLIANSNSSFLILDGDDDEGTDDGSVIKSGTNIPYIILVNRSREFEVRNSLIEDCGYYSPVFPLFRGGMFVACNNTTVSGSTFQDCHTGLIYINSRNASITGNTFDSENGIAFINTHTSSIVGNTFSNERNDILFQIAKDNIIANNTINGKFNETDSNSTGIELWYTQNATVFNNTITGKGNAGISVTLSASNNITTNVIAKSTLGINVTRRSNVNVFFSNDIAEVDTGININNSKTNSIVRNSIDVVNGTGINAFANRKNSFEYNAINDSKNGAVYDDIIDVVFHNNSITNVTEDGVSARMITQGNITNNTFTSCGEDVILVLGSTSINLTDNHLPNGTAEGINTSFFKIEMTSGEMEMLNSSCGMRDIHNGSVLITKWYLHVHVANNIGVPVPNANVSLKDINGTVVDNRRTKLNGTAMWMVAIHSIDTGSSTLEYRTPHTLEVEFGGIEANSTFQVNSSRGRNITLDTSDVIVDWAVEDLVILQNIELNLLGNLTIRNGGKLSLRNFTLNMHSPANGALAIVVENGGELYLYGGTSRKSIITSSNEDGAHRYLFRIESGGIIRMDDVIVRECGYDPGNADYSRDLGKRGLLIETNSAWITDCDFEDNHIGVVVNSSVKTNIPLIDSSRFFGGEVGVLIINSQVSVENLLLYNLSLYGLICIETTLLKVTDSIITQIEGTGIHLSRSTVQVSESQIMNINGTGFTADDNSTGSIMQCQITGNEMGILASNSSRLSVYNSTVEDSNSWDMEAREDSVIELINTVPIKYHVPTNDNGSKIIVRYFVSFYSRDDFSYRIPYATIIVEEYITEAQIVSTNTYLTDSKGEVHLVLLTSREIVPGGLLVHYYNITTTKVGFSTCNNRTIVFNNITRSLVVVINDITPPDSDAGEDARIYQGTIFEFDGSNSFDNVETVNYTWTFVYSQNNRSLYGSRPTFRFDIPGIYNVILRVKDRNNNVGTDSMILTVLMLPFDDVIYTSKSGIAATLHFVNTGPLPVLDIILLDDDVVTDKSPSIGTIGMTFSIRVGNISSADWDVIEIGINYSKKDFSHITSENKLDIYREDSKGKWARADSFSVIDTEIDIINANVTSTGNFTVMGPIDIYSPYVLMNRLTPAKDAKNVHPDTSIKAAFSEKVKDVTDKNFVLLDANNNPVPGAITTKHDEAVLLPDAALEYGSRYSVLLKTDITDIYGNPLEENVTWSFTTVQGEKPPEVQAVYPENGQENVSIKTQISIGFTSSILRSTIENGISITPNINYSIRMTNNNMSVIITPSDDLAYDTTYSVVLGTNIKSASLLPLTDKFYFNFTTEGEPVVPEEEKDEDGFEINMTTASMVLLIGVILLLIILMYITFRNRYLIAPTEEITEEIGEIHSCPECGEAVDPGDRTCGSCGIKLKKMDFKVSCSKCGTPLEFDDKKCPSCGHKPKERTKPIAKKETERKNKCPFCGAEIEEEAESCPVCGEDFGEDESDFVCDNCGTSVEPGEVICPVCGENFFEDEMVCSECGAPIKADDEMCENCGEIFDEEIIDLDEEK